MIYSAIKRPSLVERFVNFMGSVLTTFVIWFLVFTGAIAIPRDASLLLTLAGLAVSLAIGVVVHECGHLIVGTALGRTARKMRIGSGPTLLVFRLRGVLIQFCMNPLDGGVVFFSGTEVPSTEVDVVSTAAGPGMNLIAAMYAVGMVRIGFDWMGPFALANLLLGVANLIPFRFTAGGREGLSDGMQIVRSLLRRPRLGSFYEGNEIAPDSRAVLLAALQTARDAGATEVTDLHLLIGLNENTSIKPLLAGADVRALVERSKPKNSDEPAITWSAVTDLVETAAFRIARDLGRTKPNAACFCLALMAIECPAGALLKGGAVSEVALRELALSTRAVDDIERPSSATSPDLPLERWGTAADLILALAFRVAAADRSQHVGTEHIIAAMMAEPNCRAARALAQLGFVLSRNEKAVAANPPATAPVLSPRAYGAVATALRRTGPSYPAGTGEVLLGIADQGTGMGAFLLLHCGISTADLEQALRLSPRDPSDPAVCTETSRRFWDLRGSARIGVGRWMDARADFQVLLRTATTDKSLALARNNLAWASLMSGDPSLYGEALEMSLAAYTFNPDQPAFKGTHAFALLANGSTAEAAALLETVAGSQPRPRDRALDLCLLAISRARLHDLEAARTHLKEAEEADPRCALLDCARAEIAEPGPVSIAAGPA